MWLSNRKGLPAGRPFPFIVLVVLLQIFECRHYCHKDILPKAPLSASGAWTYIPTQIPGNKSRDYTRTVTAAIALGVEFHCPYKMHDRYPAQRSNSSTKSASSGV